MADPNVSRRYQEFDLEIRLLQIYFFKTEIWNFVNHRFSVLLGLVYGVWPHFQQYFSYIVVVSFIGEGNLSTRRKQPTCRKSLTNFIT